MSRRRRRRKHERHPRHRCVDCGVEIPEGQETFVLVADGDAGEELVVAVILETEDPTRIPVRAQPEGKRAKSEA